MVGFSSAAIGAYFVRLFNTPADKNQALAKPSNSVESRNELAPTTIEPANLAESDLNTEELEIFCQDADVITQHTIFGSAKTYSLAYTTIVQSFVESKEHAYVRRLTEVINALSTNPHGIEYEFYFKPDEGLRITKITPKERRVFDEESLEKIESSVQRIN
jgi:hypothetical protein